MVTNNSTNTYITVSSATEVNMPIQSFFDVSQSGTISNCTGDGTVYNILIDTERRDANNDFSTVTSSYTAPVTGKVLFNFYPRIVQIAATSTSGYIYLITSNRTYYFGERNWGNIVNAGSVYNAPSCFTDMDVGDTASISVKINGVSKVADLSAPGAKFSGSLIC